MSRRSIVTALRAPAAALLLIGASGYCLELCAAYGTINDNDTAQPLPNQLPPSVSVGNASVTEGDSNLFVLGQHWLSFDVSLSTTSGGTVTVNYQTGSNRGLAG